MHTVLSYGMGVDSSAILVRWAEEPSVRPCPLEDLILIMSQTGDEYRDTQRDVEVHILPLLRKHISVMCKSRGEDTSKATVSQCSRTAENRTACSSGATTGCRTNCDSPEPCHSMGVNIPAV